MKYVDLHLHTTFSDGSCSAKQIVRDASEIGLEVIAITDHDHTAGYFEAKKEAENWGIEVITGTEISTPNYHILGYNFDPNNKSLQEILKYSRGIQEQIVKQRITKLQNVGVPIDFDILTTYFPGARLGKGNLVTALVRNKDCRDFLGNISAMDAYKKFFGEGGIARGVDPQPELTVQTAVNAIHKAGGIAIIAHPFKDIRDFPYELDTLFEQGIDGLEVQPNYGEVNDIFEKYARKKNKIITYGSDYHGPRLRERPLLGRGNNLIEKFW